MTIGELFQSIPDGINALWRSFLDTELMTVWVVLSLIGMGAAAFLVLDRIIIFLKKRNQ